MSLVVNTNIMAANVARNLNVHYGNLAQSTQRLSTGLRINSAADDAAGLAIRELQRADIAALQQGARNANDAISLIQTADAALAIIDEKLIRMKELAEQAATGTYDSTQRLMISSEFKAMAAEIDRIANATDFNGIHLLNGNLKGQHDGASLAASGRMKVHFGTGNDAAEDYYYIEIQDCSCASIFPSDERNITHYSHIDIDWPGATIEDGKYHFSVTGKIANDWAMGLDAYVIPSGLKNITITSSGYTGGAHKPHVNLFSEDGTQLTGYSPDNLSYRADWWNGMAGAEIVQGEGFAAHAVYDGSRIVTQAGQSVTYGGLTVTMITGINETFTDQEIITIDEVQDSLVFLIGGHANDYCNKYDLSITCEVPVSNEVQYTSGIPSITTQEDAQKALEKIDIAIASKDAIRAHLGAQQNRLENTISNLTTQAENLQAAESRISDVDVATEMTQFVRNQILTQSAVAMLSQANSLPQMAMQLLGG